MATFENIFQHNSSDEDIPIAFTGCFDDYNVTSCVRYESKPFYIQFHNKYRNIGYNTIVFRNISFLIQTLIGFAYI